MMLCTMIAAGAFPGCSDEDDTPDIAQLIGEWECHTSRCNGERETLPAGASQPAFCANGTGWSIDKGNAPENFTYRLDGSTVRINGGTCEESCRLVSPTASELVTTREFSISDDGRITEYWRRLR